MRGDLASRPIGEVMLEAERLVKAGVKELLVISQDTSAYGADLKYATGFWGGRPVKARFDDLARALGSLGAWVRLHYVYPYPHVDERDSADGRGQGAALPRHPVPARQPAHPEAHEAAGACGEHARAHPRWRETCPDITIRSTFIVGFPGETEDDFQVLLDWLREARLDRVGCFKYSPVDGAAANALPDPVPDEVKQERCDRFMAAGRRDQRGEARRQGGSHGCACWSTPWTTMAPSRARAPTRPRSTAPCASPGRAASSGRRLGRRRDHRGRCLRSRRQAGQAPGSEPPMMPVRCRAGLTHAWACAWLLFACVRARARRRPAPDPSRRSDPRARRHAALCRRTTTSVARASSSATTSRSTTRRRSSAATGRIRPASMR